MPTIETNLKTASSYQPITSSDYNANLVKISQYLNDCLGILTQFMEDMSGQGFGVVSGGLVTEDRGLRIYVTEAIVWVGGERVKIKDDNILLPDNSTSYLYCNNEGGWEIAETLSYSSTKIPRAKIITTSGSVASITMFNNNVFTMSEMALQRITPVGVSYIVDGEETNLFISYLDPAISGIQNIVIEGSDDGGDTWEEIETINL